MSTPADRYHTYLKGWLHGAGRKAMDPLYAKHPTLADDYNSGYMDGQLAFRVAEQSASDFSGYTPSVLRIQPIGDQ